ncbi:MAG TPA: BrnT family toxin [Longimicrobiaceae bacterium]|nr:BrnT family toxin [Longimicrobiaceae bacterium]
MGSYEWDPSKARANEAKHGVRFSDAVAVLEDERSLTIDDPSPEEERFVTIGMDGFGRVLVVVYTWRGKAVRLISARKASRSERNLYAESTQ